MRCGFHLIKILADNSDTARATVAKLAAEVAVRGAEAGSIEECDIKDPNEVLQAIERVFRSSYIDGGLNFEIGLTGDKLETVAVAAFCAVVNVNSVWYVNRIVPRHLIRYDLPKGQKRHTSTE